MKKIYFLTSELIPFCETYSLSKLSRKLTNIFHEDPDYDIRLAQPKYGFISERKYILREVIRLKDIPIQFNNEDQLVNMKSAFIPETRVQVYFVQDDNYFKPLPELLYKAKNGRVYKENGERFAFFSRVSLSALKNLFWAPDVIMCNDWQMSFVPALIKQQYHKDDFYKNIKTMFVLHTIDDYRYFPNEAYKMLGLKPPTSGKTQDNLKFAMENADMVLLVDNEKNELMEKLEKDKELKKVFDSNPLNSVLNINSSAKSSDWREAAKALGSILLDF
ncbi:MAG: glycogen/starch synthase [Candidatus Marinimicrobia bacterium]|nr:glycogen/starch synthase [Candidatus Neomarinimicrobiota bacterium]MBL7022632.1 glycogen/starch synthase [Candidatus Neomarinimicrobiota bacterium]MBL7109625.1 glycogen/starch synthase [Candidatus Neomarinimicrobiota bacterium]